MTLPRTSKQSNVSEIVDWVMFGTPIQDEELDKVLAFSKSKPPSAEYCQSSVGNIGCESGHTCGELTMKCPGCRSRDTCNDCGFRCPFCHAWFCSQECYADNHECRDSVNRMADWLHEFCPEGSHDSKALNGRDCSDCRAKAKELEKARGIGAEVAEMRESLKELLSVFSDTANEEQYLARRRAKDVLASVESPEGGK